MRWNEHGEIVVLGLSGRLSRDEPPPGLVALVDDLDGILLGLGLSGEGEDVLKSGKKGKRSAFGRVRAKREGKRRNEPRAFHQGSAVKTRRKDRNHQLSDERKGGVDSFSPPRETKRDERNGPCRFGTTRWWLG